MSWLDCNIVRRWIGCDSTVLRTYFLVGVRKSILMDNTNLVIFGPIVPIMVYGGLFHVDSLRRECGRQIVLFVWQ